MCLVFPVMTHLFIPNLGTMLKETWKLFYFEMATSELILLKNFFIQNKLQ